MTPGMRPQRCNWDEQLEIEHQARLNTYVAPLSDSSSDSDKWSEIDWPPEYMQLAIERSFKPLEARFPECCCHNYRQAAAPTPAGTCPNCQCSTCRLFNL